MVHYDFIIGLGFILYATVMYCIYKGSTENRLETADWLYCATHNTTSQQFLNGFCLPFCRSNF